LLSCADNGMTEPLHLNHMSPHSQADRAQCRSDTQAHGGGVVRGATAWGGMATVHWSDGLRLREHSLNPGTREFEAMPNLPRVF
jgi:hypothetical protein